MTIRESLELAKISANNVCYGLDNDHPTVAAASALSVERHVRAALALLDKGEVIYLCGPEWFESRESAEEHRVCSEPVRRVLVIEEPER